MATVEEKYNALKRLHDSQNEAVVALEEANRKLAEELRLANLRLVNCQNALDINKTIMQNALTEHNAIKDGFAQAIAQLKEKIRELETGHGNIN